MKTKYKYYFGSCFGVYAVDESKPKHFAYYASEFNMKFEKSMHKNAEVIAGCCRPIPATIKEIKDKYPKFRPLCA